MAWDVEFSDEFGEWWDSLTAAEQKGVDFTVSLLQELGSDAKDASFFRRADLAAHTYARVTHSARRTVPTAFCTHSIRADNARRVRDEIQRMALDELRSAKRLTQADLAEMLDVPQSSISRIERRADMYLSTLRNYVHAMGGVLQIQAIFPDGATVAISRFGDYDDRSYMVRARTERNGTYRLDAQPLDHGVPLSTKALKLQAFTKTLKALHIPEPQISAVRKNLEKEGSWTEIGGRFAQRVFSAPDLIAAGFEPTSTG